MNPELPPIRSWGTVLDLSGLMQEACRPGPDGTEPAASSQPADGDEETQP